MEYSKKASVYEGLALLITYVCIPIMLLIISAAHEDAASLGIVLVLLGTVVGVTMFFTFTSIFYRVKARTLKFKFRNWIIYYFPNMSIWQALHYLPKDEEVWTNEGITALNDGRSKNAYSCFHKVLEFDPTSVLAWTGKGRALEGQGRSDVAEYYLSKEASM